MRLSPEQIAQIRQSGALRFAPERFRAEFTAFVEREWAAFRASANEFALWLFIRQNTVYGILP